jgi:four helix bundle protein
MKDFHELKVWRKAHELTLAVIGDAEFARFCSIAMGSASELEYHLLLAQDLKLIPPSHGVETHADRTASKAES